jgi:hypothetical protein
MLDALDHNSEPWTENAPTDLSSVVPAQEAQDAIRKGFPYEGDLRVRYLWSGHGGARYRANWFREVDGEVKLVTSLFLTLTNTEDGLVVQDGTVVG